MAPAPHQSLSRRERQILDTIYRLGKASAIDVRDCLADPPSLTSVRKLIRILEAKGHLTHTQQGRHYIYKPTTSWKEASHSAIEHLLDTFFGGSAPRAVAALLNSADTRMSREDLEELSAQVERAAERGL